MKLDVLASKPHINLLNSIAFTKNLWHPLNAREDKMGVKSKNKDNKNDNKKDNNKDNKDKKPIKHVFMDANIFLYFYDLTKCDFESLKKLTDLIKDRQMVLHLPQQVKDEICRFRADNLRTKLAEIKEEKFQTTAYNNFTSSEYYKKLTKKLDEANAIREDLVSEIKQKIENHYEEVNNFIKDLFENAKVIKTTDEIIAKAQKRVAIGNPPGKKGSLGDAIIWESLLTSVPKGADIAIISKDGDFASRSDKTLFNDFLKDEWNEAKKIQKDDNELEILYFYSDLTSFFNNHLPEIELNNELKNENEGLKNWLIDELSDHYSFFPTNIAIYALSKYDDFSFEQAEKLTYALTQNEYIHAPSKKLGLYSLYKNIYNKYPDLLSHLQDIAPKHFDMVCSAHFEAMVRSLKVELLEELLVDNYKRLYEVI